MRGVCASSRGGVAECGGVVRQWNAGERAEGKGGGPGFRGGGGRFLTVWLAWVGLCGVSFYGVCASSSVFSPLR